MIDRNAGNAQKAKTAAKNAKESEAQNMNNVKWVGTPAEYTGGRSCSKRSDRWMSPTPRTEWCFLVWVSVASIVLSCAALVGCAVACFM